MQLALAEIKSKMKRRPSSPSHLNDLGAEGWEAVGLTLKRGDLVAWPVVLMTRPGRLKVKESPQKHLFPA